MDLSEWKKRAIDKREAESLRRGTSNAAGIDTGAL